MGLSIWGICSVNFLKKLFDYFIFGCTGSLLLILQLLGRASPCRGISCCGACALGCVGSVVVACGLSFPKACEILVPRPGIESMSHALQSVFLTSGPPGKPQSTFFVFYDFSRIISPVKIHDSELRITVNTKFKFSHILQNKGFISYQKYYYRL